MTTGKVKTVLFNQSGLIIAIIFIVLILVLTSGISDTYSSPSTNVAERWSYSLPAQACSTGGTDCHISSPVLADLDGDDILEIIVATNNGHIVALNQNNGSVRWNKDISTSFGAAANTNEIASSPAVADIDADGQMEVVVGVGSTDRSICTQGGVVVLDHAGNVQSGWPQKSYDTNNNGCTESVYSTPALGDLDNDGYLEIVTGGFDKRVNAWRYDGSLMPGFPIDSHLLERFPAWADLRDKLADTIWSSPALADLDGDGYLDIVIGSDEGNFDDSWGGDAEGWTCPYTPPLTPGYCGGALYAIDRFGQVLPGFPKYILETIQSSPALADIDLDGFPEIFVGTGSFYYNNSPERPTYGFRLHGWDKSGKDLSGWSGGQVVDNVVSAAPSIGDIAGDAEMEIVVGTKAGTIYAWHTNGQLVSGFPMIPHDLFGNVHPFSHNFVLGDYDGDGKMEIFVNQASMVAIVDGNGQQLTVSNTNTGAPAYRTFGANQNGPAVSDVDDDGRLELVAHNDTLYLWDLDSSTDAADWPMFKHNQARTSYMGQPMLAVTPGSFTTLHLAGSPSNVEFDISVENIGVGCFDWQATASQPGDVLFSPTSGTICEGEETAVPVTIPTSGLNLGTNDLGTITITGSSDATIVANSPLSVPLTIHVANEIYNAYLPITQK